VAEACAGLHAAHVLTDEDGRPRNLVHRDVSPQNLFITYDGQVKVLDFGIAHAVDRSTRTETGQIKGKFEYMSPEQVRAAPLDRRSDVFALGIVLYELSTGRRLFKRANPADVVRAISEGDVVPPSRLVADYPPSLERVCMRALAQAPEDRYATSAEMRRELLAAMHELPHPEQAGEALGKMMEMAFADRITEKRELLRRVRSGSDVSHVPASEADEAVEMPGMPAMPDESPTSVERPTTTDPQPPRRRLATRSTRVFVGVASAALIATAFTWGLSRAPSPPPPLLASASLGASPLPSSAPPPSVATDVVVHLDTRPSGATVLVDGSERGATPIDLRIPRGDRALALVLRRTGFLTLEQTLVPDADQKVLLDLQPRPASNRRPSAPSASPASTSANPWAKWN
jgi:serine/threonine-protein kinase